MPIILVFTILAACLPIKWPAPMLGHGNASILLLTGAACCLSLLAAFTLRTWVVRSLRRDPSRKHQIDAVYGRFRLLMLFVNLGLVALCVLVFGWGWYVQRTFVVADPYGPGTILAPFAELLVPGPYFVIVFGVWGIYYDVERSLHRTNILGPVDRPFASRASYVLRQFRQFVLLVMLPVGLYTTQQTLVRFAPEITQTTWYHALSTLTIPLLMMLLPLFIKPLLGLQSLPAGPVRDRLEALAARLHFRCTDFLLWPTHGAMANAMLLGLLPRVRYVIFTDRILEGLSPEELDAVFGHEVGHAKHGHLWLYGAFILLSLTMLAAVVLLIGQQVKPPEWAKDWLSLPPVILLVAYIFVVFGYLSRRCERQADLYGCRAVSCGNPTCTGHDENTVYPERATGLCPTGIHTFIRGLERVGYLNEHGDIDPVPEVVAVPVPESRQSLFGAKLEAALNWLRAWQHSTAERRVDFLMSLIGNWEREAEFQRSVAVLRWVLLVGLAVAVFVLGNAVGWPELLREL